MARSLAEAGDDHADEGATAGDTHKDPADHVVDVHESSGRELVQGGGVLNISGSFSNSKLSFGKGVTRCELARGAESPDDTGDPPGEATTAGTAADETLANSGEATGDHHADTDEEDTGKRDHLLGETPGEPCDKVTVDISQISSGVLSSAEGLGTSSVNSVVGSVVGVGESELAEEDAEGDETTAAGESAKAGDGSTAGTGASELRLESVHL